MRLDAPKILSRETFALHEVSWMGFYYTLLQSRSHAFILDQRMKNNGVRCELTYMPREIMKDLCNMGLRFTDSEFRAAIEVIRHSGLPGCKLYKEAILPEGSAFSEVDF